VEPGEIVVFDASARGRSGAPARARLQCIFEYVYFARPDSKLYGAA